MVDSAFYDTHKDTTSEWYTPLSLFRELNEEFHFVTDAAAESSNRLGCQVFFTKDIDGLKDHINRWQGTTFINPPYSDRDSSVYQWVEAASDYSKKTNNMVVMLLGSTTGVKWFQDFVWDDTKHNWRAGVKVRFPSKRLQFVSAKAGASKKHKSGCTFASIIVIFSGGAEAAS
jgi:phage N-6-adenine-methyltransferase